MGVKSLDEKSEINLTFAREKKMFKVIMCQRSGSRICNGKYSIQGMENDALLFAKNDNIKLKIMRIYVNEEEDESIWALREMIDTNNNSDDEEEEEHRDYYICLASATDEVPPECGW